MSRNGSAERFRTSDGIAVSHEPLLGKTAGCDLQYMERIVAVIPARMGSTRFPGKPLAKLLGRPMIEHVVRRAQMCGALAAVFIATCDEEIRNVAEALGIPVLMTSPAHERASERVAEAAEKLEADIIVMIQGDEPMIVPAMIEAAARPLQEDPSLECVNLVRLITSREEYLDPNTIKVVMDVHANALYFSRAPIPSIDFQPEIPVFKQVCVIPFRRDFLRKYASLSPTPLEQAESIDMLRVIESGGRVRLVKTEVTTYAVDTPDDLRLVEALMMNDPLVPKYGVVGTGV